MSFYSLKDTENAARVKTFEVRISPIVSMTTVVIAVTTDVLAATSLVTSLTFVDKALALPITIYVGPWPGITRFSKPGLGVLAAHRHAETTVVPATTSLVSALTSVVMALTLVVTA